MTDAGGTAASAGSADQGAHPDGHHPDEAEIDEALDETFPSSDPPSTWAGIDGSEAEG